MITERKKLFSRGDVWAILFLVACMLIGSAFVMLQKEKNRLPPELLINTVKKSSDNKKTQADYPAKSGLSNMPLIININTAPADSFELLPGIGPKFAEEIIAYRSEHGDFNSLEELTNVNGIGPKTLANIINNITLE